MAGDAAGVVPFGSAQESAEAASTNQNIGELIGGETPGPLSGTKFPHLGRRSDGHMGT